MANPCEIGLVYVNGTLRIQGGVVARLGADVAEPGKRTINITGNLNVGLNTVIIMNDQTIFVETEILTNSSSSFVGGGEVIAACDINLSHATSAETDDVLLILSISGDIVLSAGVGTTALFYAPAGNIT